MGNTQDGAKPRTSKQWQEYEEDQYLAKVNSIPELSKAEENLLLTRWREHRDLKARNKVVEANLRLVPPIAKATVKRFGIYGDGFMTAYFELIAAGAEALMRAPNSFDPSRGYPFQHYARRCIKRECLNAATRLRSVVSRPKGAGVPIDMYIDPSMPDVVDDRDYCGSRSRPVMGGSDNPVDEMRSPHVRLRPPIEDLRVEFHHTAATLGSKIYDLRKAGLTLKETAAELGMSITTVWRHQKAHTEAHYG